MRSLWGVLRQGIVLIVIMGVISSCASRPTPHPVMIGTSTNAAMEILASLYAVGLHQRGYDAQVIHVDDPIHQLERGEVDIVPALTGDLLSQFAPDSSVHSARQVYRMLVGMLPEGLSASDYAQKAFVTPQILIENHHRDSKNILTVHDWIRRCDHIKIAVMDREFFPDQLAGCRWEIVESINDPSLLQEALAQGNLNAVWVNPLVWDKPITPLQVLPDPLPQVIRAENFVSLYRAYELGEDEVIVLNQVAGLVDNSMLRYLIHRLEQGADPYRISQEWIDQHPLDRS